MMEELAARTDLVARWDLDDERTSRRKLIERFYEARHVSVSEGSLIKILDPDQLPRRLTRAVLMIRDPVQVARSANKIGQTITSEQVTGRVAAFREVLGDRCDEVEVGALRSAASRDVLFERLKERGWPILVRSSLMETRSVR